MCANDQSKHRKRAETRKNRVQPNRLASPSTPRTLGRPKLERFSHRVSRRSPGHLQPPRRRRGTALGRAADRTNPGPTPFKTAMWGESRAAAVSHTRDSFDSSSAFPPLLPLIFSLPFSLPTDKNQNSVTQYGGRTSERLSRDSAGLLGHRREKRTYEPRYGEAAAHEY